MAATGVNWRGSACSRVVSQLQAADGYLVGPGSGSAQGHFTCGCTPFPEVFSRRRQAFFSIDVPGPSRKSRAKGPDSKPRVSPQSQTSAPSPAPAA